MNALISLKRLNILEDIPVYTVHYMDECNNVHEMNECINVLKVGMKKAKLGINVTALLVF